MSCTYKALDCQLCSIKVFVGCFSADSIPSALTILSRTCPDLSPHRSVATGIEKSRLVRLGMERLEEPRNMWHVNGLLLKPGVERVEEYSKRSSRLQRRVEQYLVGSKRLRWVLHALHDERLCVNSGKEC